MQKTRIVRIFFLRNYEYGDRARPITSKNIQYIFVKLGANVKHHHTMCRECAENKNRSYIFLGIMSTEIMPAL